MKSTSDQTGVFDATDDVSVLAITFSNQRRNEGENLSTKLRTIP